MATALFGGWFLVYFIVWRGLHQSGYIIWFTALFPYTVMSVLLIRAVTLPGAVDGLMAYIHVRMPKIVNERNHGFGFETEETKVVSVSTETNFGFLLTETH